MTELTDAATAYLNAGLQVIALTGKRPNTAFHPNGLLDPISGSVETDEDRALLAKVFEAPETTGIGILIPEHYLVADVDTDAAAALLASYSHDIATPTAKTRNGLHVWFFAPGAKQSHWLNSNGVKTLLLRGAGSYVAAPPSVHPDGGVYAWLWPLVVNGMIGGDSDIPGLADLPEGIAEVLRAADVLAQGTMRKTSSTLWQLTYEDGKFSLHTEACDPDVAPLARAVAEAKEGNRNNMLAWAAMTAAEEGISIDVAMPPLTEAALKAGLDARETKTTIRQAYRRHRG
jgi:hypothetical protein